jgi:hypothetical protein
VVEDHEEILHIIAPKIDYGLQGFSLTPSIVSDPACSPLTLSISSFVGWVESSKHNILQLLGFEDSAPTYPISGVCVHLSLVRKN